ncbi:29596_t:CDS:2, partial [Gigaspora margarita]
GAYIIRQNSSQSESSLSNELSKMKNNSPLDQPNNPSPSSHSKPKQEEDSTQERNTKIKQLVSENEYLLKTNPQLVPIPDNYIGELLDKGYSQNWSNVLSTFGRHEDYQQEVPPNIKEKMTVHWVKNCQELKDLVFKL